MQLSGEPRLPQSACALSARHDSSRDQAVLYVCTLHTNVSIYYNMYVLQLCTYTAVSCSCFCYAQNQFALWNLCSVVVVLHIMCHCCRPRIALTMLPVIALHFVSQMKAVQPLLAAMGNTHYPDSQRQAALALKVCHVVCMCVCGGGGGGGCLKDLSTLSRFCWAVMKV